MAVAFTLQILSSPDSSTANRLKSWKITADIITTLSQHDLLFRRSFNQREKNYTTVTLSVCRWLTGPCPSAVNLSVLTIRSLHHAYRSFFCHLRCVGTRDSTVEITNNTIGRSIPPTIPGRSPGVPPKSAGDLRTCRPGIF